MTIINQIHTVLLEPGTYVINGEETKLEHKVLVDTRASISASLPKQDGDLASLVREIFTDLDSDTLPGKAQRVLDLGSRLAESNWYSRAWKALTAQATPAGEWQTVDTAPKDQTDILATAIVDGKWCAPRIIYFEPFEHRGWLNVQDRSTPVQHQPTHWMPLPAAPKAHNTGDAS